MYLIFLMCGRAAGSQTHRDGNPAAFVMRTKITKTRPIVRVRMYLGSCEGPDWPTRRISAAKPRATGILEQAGHSVVVQVVDKVTHTCFMGSLELRCRQRV